MQSIIAKKRLIGGVLLSVALVGLTACPKQPKVSTGLWVFTVTSSGGTAGDRGIIGLILLGTGLTENPNPLAPGAPDTFIGSLTWVQNESTFTMTQAGDFSIFYSATVDSSTSMSGTWMTDSSVTPTVAGTWTAVRI